MFLLKFIIFSTIFSLTKQELLWKYFPSNEFSTKYKVPTLDLTEFAIYNASNDQANRFCFVYLSIGHAYVASDIGCSTYCPKSGNFTYPSRDETCQFRGRMEFGQYLRTYDNKDGLIFLSLEGCYTVDENGNISNGTFVITNNGKFKYHQELNKTYFWTNIVTKHVMKCSMLCTDLRFDRCYWEQTEQDKEYFLRMFKHMGDDYFISPLKQQQQVNFASYNIKNILIVFGVVSIIICVCTWNAVYVHGKECNSS